MAGNWNDILKETRRASAIQRIGRNIAWEKLTRPRPADLSQVPPATDALTPEYLTAILCARHPGARVTEITLGAASSGSSDRQAFKVAYNEAGTRAGLPRDLFHKCTRDFYTRLHILRCGISANEVDFYNLIKPEIDVAVPKAYHAVLAPDSYRSSIILEDVVATQGATFFEIGTPFFRADIEGMLAILASVHAKFWESPRLDREFKSLMTPLSWNIRLRDGMEFTQLIGLGLERAQAVLPPSLAGQGDKIWRALLKSLEISSSAPFTYIHGDPHLRNYYRTAAGTVGLADWQTSMRGRWTHDYVYTLLTCTPVESRRAWEGELLEFYLDRVRAQGGSPPAFDEAWQLYRRQTLYTLVAWLTTIGYGALQPSMQPDAESLEIIKRAAAAIDDHNSIALLLGE